MGHMSPGLQAALAREKQLDLLAAGRRQRLAHSVSREAAASKRLASVLRSAAERLDPGCEPSPRSVSAA
jgi:hypothetical protein